MVAHVIQRWGSPEQRQKYLPALARGNVLAASPSPSPTRAATPRASRPPLRTRTKAGVLNGHKKWTTFGQIAGLFLVLAQFEGRPTAFLVERESPGLTVRPLHGVWGTRASQLAELTFEGAAFPT